MQRYKDWEISIHASEKEATDKIGKWYSSPVDFNPRLREGGDVELVGGIVDSFIISIHASEKEATSR